MALNGVKSGRPTTEGKQDRRASKRNKLAVPVRIQPEEMRHGAEVTKVSNYSKGGFYFQTTKTHYYQGMRLRVVFPYYPSSREINVESVAKIVRIEKLTDSDFGIGVAYLLR